MSSWFAPIATRRKHIVRNRRQACRSVLLSLFVWAHMVTGLDIADNVHWTSELYSLDKYKRILIVNVELFKSYFMILLIMRLLIVINYDLEKLLP